MGTVATGIEKLDDLLDGGLVKNKAYLVSGEPGTGKTTFGLQYVYAGLKKGEPAVYVTSDEKPEEVLEGAKSLGWDFKKYLDNGKLIILNISPYLERMEKENKIDFNRMISNLAKYVHKNNAKRLVLDSIRPLLYSETEKKDPQEHIRSLIFQMEDTLNCTILLTSPMLDYSQNEEHFGIEEFLVSGVIELTIRKGDRPKRIMFVRKMRGSKAGLSEHMFDILPAKGIVINRPYISSQDLK